MLMILAGAAQAAVPLGSDFRVSITGTVLNDSIGANDPAVAYNSRANEYLVVWYADTPQNDEFEIWCQRYSASGTALGGNFKISNTGPAGNTMQGAISPAVAHNSVANEYLVVWYADPVTIDEIEIYGQRLSATGAELGADDFQISNTGAPGDTTRAAVDPAVTYNSQDNEYLVAWYADALADEDYEIFGQRVSEAGAPIGTDDFKISDVLPTGSQRGAFAPAVAYSSGANEYLAIWYADGQPNAKDEYEIFGQRISPVDGAELAGASFPISNVPGNTTFDALNPAVTYNSQTNQYLAAWWGDRPEVNDEFEIFGQLISAADGAEFGGDFRISNVGADGDTTRAPAFPTCPPPLICSPLAHNYVGYNPHTNQYLVSWTGNPLPNPDKYEIFGQFVSAAGAEVGGDFQVSKFGVEGPPPSFPFTAGVAANSRADEYLVTWEGNGFGENLFKNEVFARRLGPAPPAQPPAPPPPAPPAAASSTPKALRLSVRAARFQRALRTGALVLRVTCNERCTLSASARVSIPGASKTYRLRSVRRTLAAGRTVTLKIKLSRKVKSAARRALKARKRVTATVNIIARDAAGKRRTGRRVIRIRR